MSFGYEEDHVWILFDKHHEVAGVYANESDCKDDAEYLGAAYKFQQWAIDFQTVAVEK